MIDKNEILQHKNNLIAKQQKEALEADDFKKRHEAYIEKVNTWLNSSNVTEKIEYVITRAIKTAINYDVEANCYSNILCEFDFVMSFKYPGTIIFMNESVELENSNNNEIMSLLVSYSNNYELMDDYKKVITKRINQIFENNKISYTSTSIKHDIDDNGEEYLTFSYTFNYSLDN